MNLVRINEVVDNFCIHYTGGTISNELRKEMEERLGRVYNSGNKYEWTECPGCGNGVGKPHPCMGDDSCEPMKCAIKKKIASCFECKQFNLNCNPQVGYRCGIEAKNMLADDVTWAILPYVPDQYGN